MKHLLFVFAILSASNSAWARYSPADCREALQIHAWRPNPFTKLSRLDGHLEGASDATLLLQLKGPTDELILPKNSPLTTFPEQSFVREGRRYALVHGRAEDLLAARRDLIVVNGGRKISYQVIDRTPVEAVEPKLGRELTRRFGVLAWLARPFVKADRWLDQFAIYKTPREFLARHTAKSRASVARRLHLWRNPTVDVSPYVLGEIRACVGAECPVPPAEVDLIQHRLEQLSVDVASGLKLSGAGSLTPFTVDLLSYLDPKHVQTHEAAVSEAGLGDWDPMNMTRYQRSTYLTRAWTLIERARRGDPEVGPRTPTVAEVDEASRAIREKMDHTEPALEVSPSLWAGGEIDDLLFAPQYEILRQRRPFTVIRGSDGLTVVVVPASHVMADPEDAMVSEISAIAGAPLSPAVSEYVRGKMPAWLDLNQAHDPEILRDLWDRQEVAAIEKNGVAVWLIPAAAPAQVEFARRPMADRTLAFLTDVVRRRANALAGAAGRIVVRDPTADFWWSMTYARDERADGRPVIRVGQLDRLEVVDEDGSLAAARLTRHAFADLLAKSRALAPLNREGVPSLVLEDSTGERAWRFEFKRKDSDDVLAVSNVREIKIKSANDTWKSIAQKEGLQEFDQTTSDEPYFVIDDQPVARLAMSPIQAARAQVKYGIEPERIFEVLRNVRNVPAPGKCAVVAELEICLGSTMGTFGRVTEVRPAKATRGAR